MRRAPGDNVLPDQFQNGRRRYGFWLVPDWHQSEARTAAAIWNWSGKTLSPEALLAVLYFSSFHIYFSARLDFPSSPLSAPGSPRMHTIIPFFDLIVNISFWIHVHCVSQDYMTDGHKYPTPDDKQESDWNVTNLTERDGRTVIEFTRKQNTSDLNDHVIGVSTLHCNGETSQLIV